MNETLLTLYIVTICAVFVVLLGWLVWMLVDHIRGNNDGKEQPKKVSSSDDYADQIASLSAEVNKLKAEKAEAEAKAEVAPAPAPVPAPVVEEKKEDYGPQIAEMLAEIKSLREEQAAMKAAPVVVEEAPAPVVEEKVEEPVVEEEAATEEPATEEVVDEDDDTVVLRRSETVTYAQAYASLSKKDKGYADEILAYAKAKEDAKEIINDRAATVYLGKKQLVRLFIRKGIVIAKLIMPNNQLNAYADNNDLNIKEKPIDIKIIKPELVGSVKDIIDLVYDALIVDRNRREEEKKERRRQARLAKKAQEQK